MGKIISWFKTATKQYVEVDDQDNPFPVKIVDGGGGGGGGSMNVNIASDSAGLATAAGQQDIVDAIQALGGGDTSSAIYSGTANVTTTAAALTAQAIGEAIVQNDADSTNDVFIGNNTAQDWRLKPGEWVSVKVSNLNLIYAKTSTGTATLRYFARSAAGIGGGGGSPVPVQLTGRIVAEGNPAANVGSRTSVAAATVVTVYETTVPGLIDYIYVIVQYDVDVRIGLSRYDASGNLRPYTRYINNNESSTALTRLKLDDLVALGSWGPFKYSGAFANGRKAFMTFGDPIVCPYGYQLTVENTNPTDGRWVFPVVNWREMTR